MSMCFAPARAFCRSLRTGVDFALARFSLCRRFSLIRTAVLRRLLRVHVAGVASSNRRSRVAPAAPELSGDARLPGALLRLPNWEHTSRNAERVDLPAVRPSRLDRQLHLLSATATFCAALLFGRPVAASFQRVHPVTVAHHLENAAAQSAPSEARPSMTQPRIFEDKIDDVCVRSIFDHIRWMCGFDDRPVNWRKRLLPPAAGARRCSALTMTSRRRRRKVRQVRGSAIVLFEITATTTRTMSRTQRKF